MIHGSIPSLPIYPGYAGIFHSGKTTIQIMREHFNENVVAVVADTNIGEYPHEIQALIRKIRMYFQKNDSTHGVKNMMGKIEEYLYYQKLERGNRDSLEHWRIVNDHQRNENLTPIENTYREVMRGENVQILSL